VASQTALTQADEAARTQAHRVSIDEEPVDLVTCRRAHDAAAWAMTTVDDALDVLVTRAGMAAR
jgi:flagellar hook-associated protein FlgK